MMDATINHIEILDEVPYVKGRHVKVKMVAQMYLTAGVSIDEVMAQYDLSPAQVYAALAYYYDHQDYFDQIARDHQPLIDQAKRESQDRRARMRARLDQSQQDK